MDALWCSYTLQQGDMLKNSSKLPNLENIKKVDKFGFTNMLESYDSSND